MDIAFISSFWMKGGIATHYFCDNKYKVLLSWENWDVWPLYLHKSFMIWTLPWFPDWFSIMLSYALSTIATLNCLHCPTDAMFSRMSKPLQKTQLKWQFSVILFSALRRSISPVGLCADSDHLHFFLIPPKSFWLIISISLIIVFWERFILKKLIIIQTGPKYYILVWI